MVIAKQLEKVRERISAACEKYKRDPGEITLVAVSKTKPTHDILEARNSLQFHFGENRAKELQNKMEQIEDEKIIWHFIGNLQTNKIKYMVERVNWIDSIHKKKALKEVEKRASQINRHINVLIQVNISDEDQKSGCDPKKLEGMLKYAQELKYTHVKGVMGMATFTDNPDLVRKEFRLLKKLRDEHLHMNGGSVSMDEVSMGMTNDLEVAIEEGSTMVRVGTAIFGERNYS